MQHDGGSVTDGAGDAQVKVYPWVSTYLGAGGCGTETSGDRRSIRLLDWGYNATADREGRLFLFRSSTILYVDQDQVVPLWERGGGHARWSELSFPVALSQSEFGPIYGAAAVSPEQLFLRAESGIAVIEGGWLRWLAGSYTEFGHVDGVGTAARFRRTGGLLVRDSGDLVVPDGAYLRRVVGDEVSTIAGSRVLEISERPKDGAATTEATLSLVLSLVEHEGGLLFFDRGLLRELRDGQVRTLGGAFIADPSPDARPSPQDGPLAEAVISHPLDFVRFDGDIYFLDHEGPQYKQLLRRIRAGVVETVGQLRYVQGGPYRDGPLAEAVFDGGLRMVGGPRLLLYNAASCRAREVELR